MLQKQHVYAWLASAVKCDISCQQKGETAARQSRRALVYHRTKVIRYMKHWAGRYSSAGVGLERGADPRLWRCIPPSGTDPAPGSAAASGGSAPGRRTSARTDHTASFGVSKHSRRGSARQRRQAVPSCSSLSLWSAGIRRTGTSRRRSALCSLGVDRHKQWRETLPNLQIAELVKCVTVTSASCTCEHEFPLVQQTPVRN